MTQCTHCGASVDDTKFCPHCGAPLGGDGTMAPAPPQDSAAKPDQPETPPAPQPSDQAERRKDATASSGDAAPPVGNPLNAPFGVPGIVPPRTPSAPTKKKTPIWRIVVLAVIALFILGTIGSCVNSCGGSSAPKDTESQPTESSQSTQDDTVKRAEKEQAAQEKAEKEANELAEARESLASTIETSQGMDAAAYTADSYAALTAAIEGGQKILAEDSATKAQVTSATKAITTAVSGLKEAFNAANYEWADYADVARSPDSYTGKKLAFSGKVLQVVEGSKEINLRVATDGAWDSIVFVGYDKSLLDFRVLEDDMVTIYGTCIGLYSYESTMGAKISLPGMYLDQIELQ